MGLLVTAGAQGPKKKAAEAASAIEDNGNWFIVKDSAGQKFRCARQLFHSRAHG